MKKISLLLIIGVLLRVAYITKPDDKTCIEVAVKAVWGNRMPDKNRVPEYYGQFMALNSPNVIIDDWIFLKRIRYKFPDHLATIGIGIFKQVIVND